MKQIDFMEIKGIKAGHAENLKAGTGCTVLICENGATVGVDVRGGAPGTRETDLLDPVNLIEKVHAIVLTGGSAFGLDSAAGVMQYLEENNIGFDVQVTKVPIVCGAALFDLALGDHRIRPDKKMGYQACLNSNTSELAQGCKGVGAGASAGKILGMDRAVKTGIGHYALKVGDLEVGALVAVNCLGDIIDPLNGKKLVGPLNDDMMTLNDTEEIMIKAYADNKNPFTGNTSLGVVTTNATFTKAQATKLASMAQNGFARTMRPAHSMFDGDTIFTMAHGNIDADLSVVGLLAARTMERAVIQAVKTAESMYNLKCFKELKI